MHNKDYKDYKDSMKSDPWNRIVKYALRSVIGRLRDFEKKYSKDTPENKIYSDKNLIEVLLADCQETINSANALTPIEPRTDKIWESLDGLTTSL